MWLTLPAIGLATGAAVWATLRHGASRWRARTERLRARLRASRQPIAPAVYDPRELEGLPPPVQRYFETALVPGQAMIAGVEVEHVGELNAAHDRERWARFTSQQLVTTRRPGFVWDARIRMAPGVTAFVHDAYIAGEGILHAALLGLVTVADLHGTPEIAQGELMRFLAEAAWYPTALLPSQGVGWAPLDAHSARATVIDGGATVSLDVHFDAHGLVETLRAPARHRTVGRELVRTPWEAHVWGYQTRQGMRVPLKGEVAWILPERRAPYWRGRIIGIAYEFAP